MSTYAIRGGREGKQRLDLLARTMAPTTEALLTLVGVRPAMVCLDLGCGAGHVSRRLAALVGEEGRVVGLDIDAVKLDSAREECGRAGIGNVEFRAGNLTEWNEKETYDLVYGRFILSHVRERLSVVARARRALKPGGTLVLEDIDFAGAFCYPPSQAYDRYCELYRAVVHRRGGDADLGLKLYHLCLEGGLKEVRVRAVQPVHGGREPEKELSLSTLVNIGDSVLAEGLATAPELGRTVAELTAFTEDPSTVVGCPRVFQVWGRAP